MSTTKMRVIIPNNPETLISLGTSIYKKHTTDGTASPLNSMVDYKWEDEGPKLTLAQEKHNEAEALKKQMEKAYKERDLIMTNFKPIIRASRDLLSGINKNNLKRLGDWGFTVESSPASSKKKTESEK
jgi:hypothetical protein